MKEIDELQRRIAAAMDRVSKGVEAMGQAASAPEPQEPAGPDEETLQALDEERTANAQLTERVRVLKEKSETETRGLRQEAEDLRRRLSEGEEAVLRLDTELQRVRRANAQLADACAALQAANAEGVGDAHLINKAMMAELEALRAARSAEAAEAEAILSALAPLVGAQEGKAAPAAPQDSTEGTA